jgi:hypothetical protein
LALFGLAWDIKRPSEGAMKQKLQPKTDIQAAA